MHDLGNQLPEIDRMGQKFIHVTLSNAKDYSNGIAIKPSHIIRTWFCYYWYDIASLQNFLCGLMVECALETQKVGRGFEFRPVRLQEVTALLTRM